MAVGDRPYSFSREAFFLGLRACFYIRPPVERVTHGRRRCGQDPAAFRVA